MSKTNSIKLKIKDESILISQSEFWYFKNMLNNISFYYSSNENKSKNILIKIPGTEKYKYINISYFNQIKEQIDSILKIYIEDHQLF